MSDDPYKKIVLPLIKHPLPDIADLFKPTEEELRTGISDGQRMFSDVIALIRKMAPDAIGKELASVQPVPSDIVKEVFDNAMSEEELIANGYEPLCPHTRLTWIKKDE